VHPVYSDPNHSSISNKTVSVLQVIVVLRNVLEAVIIRTFCYFKCAGML